MRVRSPTESVLIELCKTSYSVSPIDDPRKTFSTEPESVVLLGRGKRRFPIIVKVCPVLRDIVGRPLVLLSTQLCNTLSRLSTSPVSRKSLRRYDYLIGYDLDGHDPE